MISTLSKSCSQMAFPHRDVGIAPERAFLHKRSTLMCAAQSGHLGIVQLLIAVGTELMYALPSRGDSLYISALANQVPVGPFLLSAGHNIESRIPRESSTSLQVACEQLSLEFAEMLLPNGADVDAVDLHGCTPLDLASLYEDRPTFDLIQRHGGSYGRLGSQENHDRLTQP